MSSDIARIRREIELECVSMVHASLFASTASHSIIEHKYDTLDKLTQELSKHVPKEDAIATVITAYDVSVEGVIQ